MKLLSKTVFVVYLLVLLWLILFKFSFDLPSVLLDHQARELTLIPFAASSHSHLGEVIDNLVVFIPFGLLLSVSLKRASAWQKLASIFIFSMAVEAIQFVLAIGVTDMTDVAMNTLGGTLGLALYGLSKRHVDNEKLDQFIVVTGMILLVLFILLRVLVLRVRY